MVLNYQPPRIRNAAKGTRPLPDEQDLAPIEQLHMPLPIAAVAPIMAPPHTLRLGSWSVDTPSFMSEDQVASIDTNAASIEAQIATFGDSIGLDPTRSDLLASDVVGDTAIGMTVAQLASLVTFPLVLLSGPFVGSLLSVGMFALGPAIGAAFGVGQALAAPSLAACEVAAAHRKGTRTTRCRVRRVPHSRGAHDLARGGEAAAALPRPHHVGSPFPRDPGPVRHVASFASGWRR
jgi:hypothetical protein